MEMSMNMNMNMNVQIHFYSGSHLFQGSCRAEGWTNSSIILECVCEYISHAHAQGRNHETELK